MNSPTNPTDAMPSNTEANIAVMTVELRYIKEAVSRIESAHTTSVPRTEWEQRNEYINQQLHQIVKESADLKAELASKRAPWWSVLSSFAGAAAVIIVIIQFIK